MNTSTNYGLKLYEGADLFNPLTVENVNFETLDEVLKAISDRAVGNATELKTATVHALTRTGNTDANTFVFTATSNFTAGDTFTLDGVQVSALTVAGSQLSTGAYVIGSSVLVHVRDTLLTFYVSETTAQDAERLGGELPSYYAQASALNDVIADVTALATKVGTAVLTTQAQNCSGAINELNSNLTANSNPFKFSYDLASNKYGYTVPIGGADTFFPFKSGDDIAFKYFSQNSGWVDLGNPTFTVSPSTPVIGTSSPVTYTISNIEVGQLLLLVADRATLNGHPTISGATRAVNLNTYTSSGAEMSILRATSTTITLTFTNYPISLFIMSGLSDDFVS